MIEDNGNYWAYDCGEVIEAVCDGGKGVVHAHFTSLERIETGEVFEMFGGVYLVWFSDTGASHIMLEHQLRRPGEQTWIH